MKIAMWSGPRNLSTAMMYSFGNRTDLQVWDEPFYAAYLHATDLIHPMRDAVLAAGPCDPQEVARQITAMGDGVMLKLMSFHMLDGFPMDWAEAFTHVHLLRHPARVIASYAAKRENPSLDDIGFDQQLALYRRFPGPVVSAHDLRSNPEAMLRKLCTEIGLAWDGAMLSWPPGPKPFDGIWAPHWYDAVHRSTGFAAPEGDMPDLTDDQALLMQAALPAYEALAQAKL
ncbi:MAG: HAD family hydrolase [Pseudomonadota bacterium]